MNDTHDMTEHETAAAADAPARAPAKWRDVVTEETADANQKLARSDSDKSKKPIVVQVLDPQGERTKDAWHDLKAAAYNLFATARFHTIRSLPAAVVNNSSNMLGFTHVMTEMMMFKSSSSEEKLIKDYKNPINWVVQPFETIFKDTLQRSKATAISDPKFKTPIIGTLREVVDMDAATKREIATIKAIGKEGARLPNAWQGRSTMSGLVVWGLSTLIPDKKESDEEVERMAIMKHTSPVRYTGERLKQAVWFPEWPSHKRQMIGLGIMTSGVCSLFGAFRQRETLKAAEDIAKLGFNSKYKFGGAYFMTAACTFVSSIPLLFATDNARGFEGFGLWMAQRLWFLPFSIGDKIKNKDAAAYWYMGATASFQAENFAQALAGGAEVKTDPKTGEKIVVDHDAERKAAIKKAEEARAEKEHYRETPSSKISQVAGRELAIPLRADAHEKTASVG